MDSALPDKSIKPSANADTPQNDTDDKLSIDSRNFKKVKNDNFLSLFTKQQKKLTKANATEKMLTEMSLTMKEIKDVFVNDPISEMIDYLKKESKKQTQRETTCLFLITNLFSPQQTATANASVY